MAAGQGFKTFTTGEVLTAGDVNGYLMQGINVFATTTARDAAITAPAEGQFAFTKDTNGLWYYDGAAWVASGATGDIEGVTAGVGISGGGTSGTVTVTNSMATAIDAKGDLVPGTGADTFARLAVGANDTVLTADSSTATGLKWAAVSAGPVQLATASLAGVSTYTFSSISGSYKTLLLELKDSRDSSGESVTIRINGTSSVTYNYTGFTSTGSALTNTSSAQQFAGTVNANSISSSETSAMSYVFPNYSQTNIQKVYYGWGTTATSSFVYRIGNTGNTFQTSAITSLTVNNNAVNWVAGTLTLYGVN
jgi:hypothetical protein